MQREWDPPSCQDTKHFHDPRKLLESSPQGLMVSVLEFSVSEIMQSGISLVWLLLPSLMSALSLRHCIGYYFMQEYVTICSPLFLLMDIWFFSVGDMNSAATNISA